MKIEKINDNQIRCTLTHADLAARHLKLSELAYGTEKAKSLFRDMMQQASFDFGFDAEDLPLMIEAIPSSADSIVLIITKVEDPEELDTRFSKFTPLGDSDTVNNDVLEKLQGADEFLDLLNKVKEAEIGKGFDALHGEYVDMVEKGIIDPAKVTRSALQNATSVASTLLTTESVVADIKEDTPAPAMPAGGGMGMM